MVSDLSLHFHRGDKQNTAVYHTYCKGCVAHYLSEAAATDVTSGIAIPAEQMYLNGAQCTFDVIIS